MMRIILLTAALMLSSTLLAQNAKPFDPHDLTGKWVRTSPNQGFSNVPETGRGNFPEAPFTPAGKEAYQQNYPGYGPRADAARRNDPMATCDPLGVPRNLNAEVVSSHNWWEVTQTRDRIIQFFEWHHEYPSHLHRRPKATPSDCRSRPEVERLLCRPMGRGHVHSGLRWLR